MIHKHLLTLKESQILGKEERVLGYNLRELGFVVIPDYGTSIVDYETFAFPDGFDHATFEAEDTVYEERGLMHVLPHSDSIICSQEWVGAAWVDKLIEQEQLKSTFFNDRPVRLFQVRNWYISGDGSHRLAAAAIRQRMMVANISVAKYGL